MTQALSFFLVALLGAVVLWNRRVWVRTFSYALLLLSVGIVEISTMGTPRPYWPWGIREGLLVAYIIDETHQRIYIWVMDHGTPLAMEVPFNLQAATALQDNARQGRVMIGKPRQGAASGSDDREVPFVAYPAPRAPMPPKTAK